MEDRTIGSLALCPTGNKQGGNYFLRLLTSHVLNRRKCTPLHIPEEVKERFHCLAHRNKSVRGLIFTYQYNEPIDKDDDADYDPNYDPTPKDDFFSPDDYVPDNFPARFNDGNDTYGNPHFVNTNYYAPLK